jgi:heterotetrameric sarcosine oxidase gamma subunit
VSLEFLSPGPDAIARSSMEREALKAGARLERRDGWNVAVEFDGTEAEQERCRETVGYTDLSHLGKVEVQGNVTAAAGVELELGRATRDSGMWWCPYAADRAVALCEPGATAALIDRLERTDASVVDLTSAQGAMVLTGPLAPEAFARFTAIDLRDAVTPVCGFRSGSVARTPGAVLREAEERWLMLFGAALGQYVWTVVADAAGGLGGGPVGVDALAPIPEEASSRA